VTTRANSQLMQQHWGGKVERKAL